MNASERNAPPPPRGGLRRGVRLALRFALGLLALPFLAWGGLALFLDGPGPVGAGAYLVLSLVLLVLVRPPLRGRLACAGLFLGVLAWWLSIEPRNDRDWLPDVSQLASARVEGERLTLTNVRNFEYRSETDFVPRWEERSYDLARVTGLDLVVCDWGEPLIVHTMLSWEFEGGEQHLVVSIETRKEVGEGYSALRGFFRQFELYYVVGDERDLIGVRTNVRGERVRLYRLATPPAEARALLRVYAQRVSRLAVEPAWYNAATQNCTTSIRRNVLELGVERPWNWRVLVNGYGEELLYQGGSVNASLPFEELRRKSDVTEAARAAGQAPDFSQRIRVGIPARPGRP